MKTKRTLWLLIAVTALIGFAALSLTGCDNGTTSHNHNFSGAWQKDATGHWKVCPDDGEIGSFAAHTPPDGVCTVCGYDGGSSQHTHDLTKTNALAATCKAAGNPDYWTCSECGKYYADADGATELTAAQIVIAIDTVNGHDYEWKETTPASHTAAGVETEICKHDSSHTRNTRPIPQIPFTSIATFGTWLGSQDGNDEDTPYSVVVNISDLGDSSTSGSLGYILDANDTKYVSLDLSGSTFTSIDDAFNGCENLISIIISNSVSSIGEYAFNWCINLASVTIPNSVTSIEMNAFYQCESLASVTIPNSVTSIGDYAFEYTNLTSVMFETGSNITSADFGNSAFPGGTDGDGGDSLRTAYNTGKAGTYTRAANGSTWTKQ